MACRQSRKVSNVPVREENGETVRRNVFQTVKGIGDEAALCLFTVGDDRRAGSFEALDSVSQGGIMNCLQFCC